ncbi:MAG: ribose-phosphate diphosphokinase [Verrucomicrobia bacterium]|nr:MAG: ribose-phosphate diphosphokinase [Verrucomicrobiota bacterium]
MMNGNLRILSGGSNTALAKDIADCVGLPLVKAVVTTFPDGETFTQIQENIRGADVFIVQSTCYPANHNIMELLIMIDAVKRASAGRITAVIPFFGYARQDRKDKPRVPITAKLVANILVAAGASRILTMDLHSPQITGFFDIPVDHIYAASVFYDYLQKLHSEKLTVVSPDIGGLKLAAAYADMLGCPLGIVAKRRTDAENVETLAVIGDMKGRDILIVDDMTETGGTLNGAAKVLKENGAKSVIAAVTHGVLNEKGYERLQSGYIDKLITTNTTPVDSRQLKMIEVLSVAKIFAEAIIRIHHNESVSSLFKIKGF